MVLLGGFPMGLEQKELDEIRQLIMDSMKDAIAKLHAIQMTACW